MKKITLLLSAIGFSLITQDVMAQTRKGVVFEIDSPTSSELIIGSEPFSESNKVGLLMDIETGEVYPFEMNGIEKDDIKRGMLVRFIAIPNGNNAGTGINFVYDKDAAQ